MDEKAKISNTLVTHNQHLLQQVRIFQKVFPNTMQDHLHITMPSNCSPGKKVFVVGCNCRCYSCTAIWKVVFSLKEEKKICQQVQSALGVTVTDILDMFITIANALYQESKYPIIDQKRQGSFEIEKEEKYREPLKFMKHE